MDVKADELEDLFYKVRAFLLWGLAQKPSKQALAACFRSLLLLPLLAPCVFHLFLCFL